MLINWLNENSKAVKQTPIKIGSCSGKVGIISPNRVRESAIFENLFILLDPGDVQVIEKEHNNTEFLMAQQCCVHENIETVVK